MTNAKIWQLLLPFRANVAPSGLVTHPGLVRSAVSPTGLDDQPLLTVMERGARVTGACADALVLFNETEVDHRARSHHCRCWTHS